VGAVAEMVTLVFAGIMTATIVSGFTSLYLLLPA
jgi:hypothetical protein